MNATDRSPKQPPQLPWAEIAARLAAAERPFVEVFARHGLGAVSEVDGRRPGKAKIGENAEFTGCK